MVLQMGLICDQVVFGVFDNILGIKPETAVLQCNRAVSIIIRSSNRTFD